MVQVIFCQIVNFEVFDYNISVCYQMVDNFLFFVCLEIDCNGVFVLVVGVKIGCIVVCVVLVFQKWWFLFLGVVVLWVFYFDDVSFEIGQCLFNLGVGQNLGKFDYFDVLKWCCYCYDFFLGWLGNFVVDVVVVWMNIFGFFQFFEV